MKKTLTKRKSAYTLLLLISFTLLCSSSFAKIYETKADGKWDTKSTWQNNKKPGSSISKDDTVYVKHKIKLDRSILINGTLIIESSSSLKGGKDIIVKSDGILTVISTLTIDKLTNYGTFENSGTTTIDEDLKDEGVLINTGTIIVAHKLENKSDTFTNDGTIITKDLKNDGTFINNSSLIVEKKLDNRKGEFTNNGTIIINGELKNNASFVNNDLIYIYDEFNNGKKGTYLNNDSTEIFASTSISENVGILTIDTDGAFILRGMFDNSILNGSPALIVNNGKLILISDSTSTATFIDN